MTLIFFSVKAEVLYFLNLWRFNMMNTLGAPCSIKRRLLLFKKIIFFRKNGFWRLKGAFLILAPYRYQKWKKRLIFDLGLTGFVLKAPFRCFSAHFTDSGGDSWYDSWQVSV